LSRKQLTLDFHTFIEKQENLRAADSAQRIFYRYSEGDCGMTQFVFAPSVFIPLAIGFFGLGTGYCIWCWWL
jgi:hypothetical protein